MPDEIFPFIQEFRSVNFHSIVDSVLSTAEDYKVCSCGLKFDYRLKVHEAYGHILNCQETRKIIINPAVGYMGTLYELFCQDCGGFWPAKTGRGIGRFGLPDINLEKTMAQHKTCPARTDNPID